MSEVTRAEQLAASSILAFSEALNGKRGELDAWLEVNDEAEVRAHVMVYVEAELRRLSAVEARCVELEKDARRWRRLVNASEMPFPIATLCDDPENEARMVYGRKRLEDVIDCYDEIPCEYPAINEWEKSNG